MTTIKDIAKHAGVSIATVSRALSSPQLVSEKVQVKIAEAINVLGYEPNQLAAGLRRNRSGNVLVVVPSIHNPFTSAFVQGIENVASAHKMRVLLGISDNDPALMNKFLAMVSGRQADGVILLDNHVPEWALLDERPENSPPIVVACEYPTELNSSRVNIDNVEAMSLMIEHLVGLGHRKIATIAGPVGQQMTTDRLSGAKLGLDRAGIELPDNLVTHGDFSTGSGYRAAQTLLQGGAGFTAICCANDEMAIGAIAALRECGKSVPEDVSVSGFDNLRFGEFASPPLTTIEVPTMEIGETAMRLMLDILRTSKDTGREVFLPHRLIERKSTSKPRV